VCLLSAIQPMCHTLLEGRERDKPYIMCIWKNSSGHTATDPWPTVLKYTSSCPGPRSERCVCVPTSPRLGWLHFRSTGTQSWRDTPSDFFFFFPHCSLNLKCLMTVSSYIFTEIESMVAVISCQVSRSSVRREEVRNPCYKSAL